MTPLDQVKASNAFQNREVQKARILSCYSNVGDCVPKAIVKSEEVAAVTGTQAKTEEKAVATAVEGETATK